MSEDRFREEVMRYLSAIAVDVGDIRQRVTNLEARIDILEKKVDALEKKVDEGFEAVRRDIRILDSKVNVMNQDLVSARADIYDHERRIKTLEDKAA